MGLRWSLRFFSFLSVAVLLISGVAAWSEPVSPIAETDLVDRYLTATQGQQSNLRGGTMEVEIEAEVPKLQKQGKLHALRNISKLGKITYRMLGFSGDNTVKKEVIARYLAAEAQAQAESSRSITPENYKFRYKGTRDDSGRPVYVLQVLPRHKEIGLFKGELWLDAQTYLPLRESGRFVKNPSIFLKKMEFVRTYEIQDGIAAPQRLESRVETRLFGPVVLSVNFGKFSKESDTDSVLVASGSDVQ